VGHSRNRRENFADRILANERGLCRFDMNASSSEARKLRGKKAQSVTFASRRNALIRLVSRNAMHSYVDN
jgi:hypothetical protein